MSASSETTGTAVIRVKVLPRSSRDQLAGFEEGLLKVKLTAPPLDGKANKALRSYLAKFCGRPLRDVTILTGEKARVKTLQITGLSLDELIRRIEAACGGHG